MGLPKVAAQLLRVALRLALVVVGGILSVVSGVIILWRIVKRGGVRGLVRACRRTRHADDPVPAAIGGSVKDGAQATANTVHRVADLRPLIDVDLHYVETKRKEGQPLMLFVHGFPECWYMWKEQLEEFGKDHWCVAVDQRGYATSGKPAARSAYGMEHLVMDIHTLVTQVLLPPGGTAGAGGEEEQEKFILVAHDWGGAVAWQFAHTYGKQLLKRLIILNCPHPKAWMSNIWQPGMVQARKSIYFVMFQMPWLPELLLSLNDYAFIDDFMKGLDNVAPEDTEVLKWAISRPGALTGALNLYRNAFEPGLPSLRADLRNKLRVPTLVVWGTGDKYLTQGLAVGYDRWIEGSMYTLQWVVGASHWLAQERPKVVNGHMRKWLESSVEPDSTE